MSRGAQVTRALGVFPVVGFVASLGACGPEPTRDCSCGEAIDERGPCVDGEPLCTLVYETEHHDDGTSTETSSGDPLSCGLSALRDRTPGWISSTERHSGNIEAPDRFTDVVQIASDGSFRSYLDSTNDGGDYRGLRTGELKPASYFDECIAEADVFCLFDYADAATLDSQECP